MELTSEESLAIRYLEESEALVESMKGSEIGVHGKKWLRVLELCKKAFEIKERLGQDNDDVMASICFNLGNGYNEIGEPDDTPREARAKAEKMYQKAMTIFGRLGQQENVAKVHFNLGALNIKVGDYDKVRKHWFFSRDVYEGIGNKQKTKHIEEQIADLPNLIKGIEQAQKKFNDSFSKDDT